MNIYIDIETIASGEPIDPATLTPPATMSKPETIEKWYQEKAPAIAEEKFRARALDSMAGEILCIGYAVANDPAEVVWYLEDFQEIVEDCMENCGEGITFTGWNARNFDIPWLWRQSIRKGMMLHKYINRNKNKGNILDLMEVWEAEWKDYRKLSDVAAFLGIPGKAGGLTGATIYDAYLEDRLDDIEEYCLRDVEIVREIHRRIYG